MEEKISTLYELCEVVSKELKEAAEKLRSTGSKLSAGDVEYIDKLTHTLKSIKTTIAMMESEEGGYSQEGYSQGGTMQFPMPKSMRGRSNQGGSYRGSYNSYEGGGGSYEGDSSYARRGSYRRDSRGRYSSERGYSNHGSMDDILEDMREMMGELPEEQRKEVQRFVDKMDRM